MADWKGVHYSDGDMLRMQQEAIRRVRQMQRRAAQTVANATVTEAIPDPVSAKQAASSGRSGEELYPGQTAHSPAYQHHSPPPGAQASYPSAPGHSSPDQRYSQPQNLSSSSGTGSHAAPHHMNNTHRAGNMPPGQGTYHHNQGNAFSAGQGEGNPLSALFSGLGNGLNMGSLTEKLGNIGDRLGLTGEKSEASTTGNLLASVVGENSPIGKVLEALNIDNERLLLIGLLLVLMNEKADRTLIIALFYLLL